MGLPSTGKSTFLAALTYSLQQMDLPTKLHWGRFTNDHQYLINLSTLWLEATVLSRTNESMQKNALTIELKDEEENEYSVTFPDLSGEIFQRQYKDREMDWDIVEAIKNSDGIMLFVSPAEIYEPEFIANIHEEVRRIEGGDSIDLNQEPRDVTSVQLVELLQFVNYIKTEGKTRLIVVVSAWDLIIDYNNPEEFLRERLSLLWQYLKANSDIFDAYFYGVSAQGGKIENDSDSENLIQKYQYPVERISVVDNEGKIHHDLSKLLWHSMNSGGGESV